MAREYVASITQRGQVTIPAAVRRILGAKPRDKIAFRVEGTEVRLVPVAMTLEETFSSVTPINRPEDFEELFRIAKEEKAAQTVEEMRRS